MELRITFRSEVYIKGDNLEEIREKWDGLPLFSPEAKDCEAEYVELVSVEDSVTYEDKISEFYK